MVHFQRRDGPQSRILQHFCSSLFGKSINGPFSKKRWSPCRETVNAERVSFLESSNFHEDRPHSANSSSENLPMIGFQKGKEWSNAQFVLVKGNDHFQQHRPYRKNPPFSLIPFLKTDK
jgi:hypothetical protein